MHSSCGRVITVARSQVLDWIHELSKLNDAFRVTICDALLRCGPQHT